MRGKAAPWLEHTTLNGEHQESYVGQGSTVVRASNPQWRAPGVMWGKAAPWLEHPTLNGEHQESYVGHGSTVVRASNPQWRAPESCALAAIQNRNSVVHSIMT